MPLGHPLQETPPPRGQENVTQGPRDADAREGPCSGATSTAPGTRDPMGSRYLSSPSGTQGPPAPLRLQGNTTGSGDTPDTPAGMGRRLQKTSLPAPAYPPTQTECPPPAPHTHGVHHVDVIHKVPLPQVHGELWGGMGDQESWKSLRGVPWDPPILSPPTGIHHLHPCSTQKPLASPATPKSWNPPDVPRPGGTWRHLGT